MKTVRTILAIMMLVNISSVKVKISVPEDQDAGVSSGNGTELGVKS